MEKKTTWLFVQTEEGIVSPEGAAFIDACRQKNWLEQREDFRWTIDPKQAAMRYEQLLAEGVGAKGLVPIGSIEFVQSFLDKFDLSPICAMNIPQEMRGEEFVGRKLWDIQNKGQLAVLCQERQTPLLVKPGLHPKLFEATSSKYMVDIPEGEPLFVSEIFKAKIVAEWRVFTLRDRILAIRPYILDKWAVPRRTAVQQMVKKLPFPACAMDVAILESGQTVLLEAHPFISCGLYGLEGPDLLKMATVAWQAHVEGGCK